MQIVRLFYIVSSGFNGGNRMDGTKNDLESNKTINWVVENVKRAAEETISQCQYL